MTGIAMAVLLVIGAGFMWPASGTTGQQHGEVITQNLFHKSEKCKTYFQNDETSSALREHAFINARYELSLMDGDIEWNNIYSQRMQRRIHSFFSVNVSSCVYVVDGAPVWYVTVFKAGNNNIRGNLQVSTCSYYFSLCTTA